MKTEGYHVLNSLVLRVILIILLSGILILGGFSVYIKSISAVGGSAWLKIVTPAWKGSTICYLPDGIPVTVGTPVCPAGTGFADRFNVTSMEAFVEVYGIKPEWGYVARQGVFEPNATGFVKISWSVDDTWGLLILVKAKSYYGQKIGEGSPFKGIIIYALAIPPRNMPADAKERFINMTGLYTEWDSGVFDYVGNGTIDDDGSIIYHGNIGPEDSYIVGGVGDFDFIGVNTGPFDVLNGSSVNLGSFAKAFNKPENAWVARAAKIFKVFHVHSWYDVKDNLSFAQIKIYDLDHTDPTSEASLIQAAITGEDGQSRYTREIYPPEEGLTGGKFENNKLVPIPLQIFNLNNQTVFHGGINGEGAVGGPYEGRTGDLSGRSSY